MGRQKGKCFEVEHIFKSTEQQEMKDKVNAAVRQLCRQYINKVCNPSLNNTDGGG